MNNFIVLDEQDRPVRLAGTREVLEDFYEWRLPIYQKRIDVTVELKLSEIPKIDAKIKFIKCVIDGKLVLIRGNGTARPKAELEADCQQLELDSQYIGLKGWYYTYEKIDELLKKRKMLVDEIEELKRTPPGQVWLKDLDELAKAYIKHYGDDRPSMSRRRQ